MAPFWTRLNDFFTYPFQIGPLALIGLSIALSLMFSSGVFGVLAALFVAFTQIKYGFNVIAQMSVGEFQAPSLGGTITQSNYGIVIKQFAVFVAMLFMIGFVDGMFGSVLSVPLAIVIFLVLPMSVIVLAIESSLGAALNPATLMKSAYRISWPYLLVYLYLLMMIACSEAFGQLAYEFVGADAAQIITSASGYYFLLVMYSLMGYMAYQYRYRLPFGFPTSELMDAPDERDEDPRVRVLLQRGDYIAAMDLLAGSWEQHAKPAALLDKYVKIARFAGAWEHVRRSLDSLLTGLLKVGTPQAIAPLLRDLFAAETKFEMADTGLALRVADMVRERGDSKLAARLLKNQHRLTTDAKLQRQSIGKLADILESDLGQPDIAAKYRALGEKIANQPPKDGGGLSLMD